MNLDLFGGPPHPTRSGKRDVAKEEAAEQARRSKAYHNMVAGGFAPVCSVCRQAMIITPSAYLVCPMGHTGLKDPRDYPRVHLVHEDTDEDEDQLPVSGD